MPIDIVLELQDAEIDVEASIHGALHIILSLIPVFILSSGALSIKVNCPPLNSTRTRPPRLILYGSKKSKGLLDKVFRLLKELLVRSRQVVVNCDCESGCPGCIQTPSCRISNLRLDKKGTAMLLNSTLRIM